MHHYSKSLPPPTPSGQTPPSNIFASGGKNFCYLLAVLLLLLYIPLKHQEAYKNKEGYGIERGRLTEHIRVDRTLSHVVIDIETLGLGLRPVIIAIGAVALDEHYEVIGRFYRAVRGDDQPGRAMDFATVQWWALKTSPAAREAVFHADACTPRRAVVDFVGWVMPDPDLMSCAAVQFWGKGPEFDNVIWRDAIACYDASAFLSKVWTYRNNQSLRTVELMAKAMGITVEVPATAIAHHALCDAEWEAEYLRQAMHKILALAPKVLDAEASSE